MSAATRTPRCLTAVANPRLTVAGAPRIGRIVMTEFVEAPHRYCPSHPHGVVNSGISTKMKARATPCYELTPFKSYLDCHTKKAIFRGTLDTKTLGGAGFASQRTTGSDRSWDLSSFDGLEIILNAPESDNKRYTLICKDDLAAPNQDNGREQASISWEFDFTTSTASTTEGCAQRSIFAKWSDFKPTYRGKEQKNAKELNVGKIKRFSIMVRR